MLVNEIFVSIQGEGVNAGVPSLFIRLGKCNLMCSFCDTKYTWMYTAQQRDAVKRILEKKKNDNPFGIGSRPEPKDIDVYNENTELQKMTVEQLTLRIEEIMKEHKNLNNIVITGGEPLLQMKELEELADELVKYNIEIETNGTIKPTDRLDAYVDMWNVSPKLSNSDNPRAMRFKPDVLQHYNRHPHAVFKFVITDENDLNEVNDIVQIEELNIEQIILMPCAVTKEELERNSRWLVKECIKRGYRFSSRIQVELYGDKRGV